MFDSKSVKLGKKPPKLDARTLKLGKYVDALPSPPQSEMLAQLEADLKLISD